MTRRALAAAAVLALLAACGGDDGGGTSEALRLDAVWSRATAGGASVGAIYLEVTSPVDDQLTGVTVDPSVAASAMLHVTRETTDGITTMEHIDAVELPAGLTVELAPNGTHVMLEDLADRLLDGTTFEATFEFAEAPDQTVTVDVRTDAP